MKTIKTYYHVIEDSGHSNIGWHGYFLTKEDANEKVAHLQNFFPKYYFYVWVSPSKKEPEFTTL